MDGQKKGQSVGEGRRRTAAAGERRKWEAAMTERDRGSAWTRGAGVAILGALVAAMGCGGDEIKIPDITGPATFGTGVQIGVSPDIMFADGQSSAVVVVTVSGPDGKPLAGREVSFLTGDDRVQFAAIGTLSADRVITDSNGKARTIFTAPQPKDFGANAKISVIARVTGENAVGGRFPFAQIQLIGVSQRRWPEGESNTPFCKLISEPRYGPWYAGVPIHWMTRSNDDDDAATGGYIVTYLWRFSDDDTKYFYGPDLYHTFAEPGDYIVFHSVLDNSGHVDSCNFFMTVDPAP
jgi:hypothetical protein